MWAKREAEWERERLARERLMTEVSELRWLKKVKYMSSLPSGRKAK